MSSDEFGCCWMSLDEFGVGVEVLGFVAKAWG